MNTVLGHYPVYLTLANKLRYTSCFDIPTRIWNRMSKGARWAANVQFLDQAVTDNNCFVFSSHPDLARPGSSFQREIRYLNSRGIRFQSPMRAFV